MKRAAVLLLCSMLVGCSSTPTPTADIVPANFEWTPPETAGSNSAGVNFGVVSGLFTDKEIGKGATPQRFSANLGKDFLELLTAKGFTVSGPFPSVDEMTYPEKKACDLVLTPEIDIQPQVLASPKEKLNLLMGTSGYTFQGNSVMQGRLTMVVTESLSGQRMWTKSIELPASTQHFKSQDTYPTPASTAALAMDRGLVAVQEAQLESYYQEILSKAWSYINVEEMGATKVAAEELRTRTTYQGK